MRFVLGINDDYIDPDFSTGSIGTAVDEADRRASDPAVRKVDIEVRGDDDDTLLVMTVFDKDDLDAPLSMSQIKELERIGMDADNAAIRPKGG